MLGPWQVERALAADRHNGNEVPVALVVDHGRAQIKLGPAGESISGAVLLIGFDRRHVTAVARGENGGRTLAHVDVVRSVEEVAKFTGRASAIEVPIRSPSDHVAAIVQAEDGRVLGVAVRDADPL